jgi:hypothetical protein
MSEESEVDSVSCTTDVRELKMRGILVVGCAPIMYTLCDSNPLARTYTSTTSSICE